MIVWKLQNSSFKKNVQEKKSLQSLYQNSEQSIASIQLIRM